MDNVKAQKLRNLAFGKLKEDRSKFTDEEKDIIIKICVKSDYTKTIADVSIQIMEDIAIYKKYDCLAVWLDWELGLVKYEPDLIEKIAREVGGLKIEGE